MPMTLSAMVMETTTIKPVVIFSRRFMTVFCCSWATSIFCKYLLMYRMTRKPIAMMAAPSRTAMNFSRICGSRFDKLILLLLFPVMFTSAVGRLVAMVLCKNAFFSLL